MTENQALSPCKFDDEISLLDVLITIAESWKLLMFGPLVVGVLAAGLSFLWPKTFESVAIVRLSEDEVALLHSASVLDPLIAQFDLLVKAGGVDDARQGLKSRLAFTVDKKTKLTTITAKASEANQAQALGDAAIKSLLKELKVKGQPKRLIEKTIAINLGVIGLNEDAIESVQRNVKRGALADQALESALKNMAVINLDNAKRKQENEELYQKLEGYGAEVFVQEPSFPQRKISPNRSLVVMSAMLGSGFALLLFVFVRKTWAASMRNPMAAAKWDILKSQISRR